MPSGKQLLISIGTVILILILIVLSVVKGLNSIKKQEEEQEIIQQLNITQAPEPTIVLETEIPIASPTAVLDLTPTVPVKNKTSTPSSTISD